jgi:hypothetical protein
MGVVGLGSASTRLKRRGIMDAPDGGFKERGNGKAPDVRPGLWSAYRDVVPRLV